MDDFISMMGYRETVIKRIIDRLLYDDDYDTEALCRQEGIPYSDLTYAERNRIANELNLRSREVSW